MGLRFKRIRTPRLEGNSPAEVVRREHERSIEELREVSRTIDGAPRLIGICALTMSGSQTAVASGNVIDYDTEAANTTGGIVGASNGRIRLAPGYTYRLQATVTLSSGGSDTITAGWYDVREGATVGQLANVYDPGAAGSISAQPIAHYVVSPTRFAELECRAVAAVGSPTIHSDYSFAAVEVFQ